MAKHLTVRKLRTLKAALDGPSFEWILLELPSRRAACVPVLKRKGGLLLGMPENTFTQDELTAGSVEGELEDLGPHHLTTVAANSAEGEETVEVLFLDFPESHFHALQYFPRTVSWPVGISRFMSATGSVVDPEPDELVAVARLWVEEGEARSSDAYHSAMELPAAGGVTAAAPEHPAVLDAVLVQMENLATQFAELRQEVSTIKRTNAQPSSQQTGALATARQLAGPAPSTRRPVQRGGPPEGFAAEQALEEEEVPDTEADLDTLLKTALLKMVAPKKKKEIAGVALDLASSDDEDQDPLRKVHGARGTMMQEKLRQAMDHSPQKFVEAVESHAATVLGLDGPAQDTMERYVREELPVGSENLTWGLVKVAALFRSGQHAKAHLVTLLLLSAIEQSRLDQNWNAAWRLTHLSVPPFPEWRVRESNLATLRADNAHCRLLHPTWMATVVARMRDEEVLLRKRGKPQLDKPAEDGKGKGKTGGRKGKWQTPAEKEGEGMETK